MLRKFFLFCFLALFACATPAAEPPTEPPPGAIKAGVGFAAVGTKWVGRIVPQSGPTVTLTYTVIDDGVHEGKPVHRIVGGTDTYLYDMATGNTIATLRQGKEVSSTMPHDGTFSWPLYVGKTWTATYTFNDRLQGMTVGPVNVEYRATTYEDVTVPAGSWKAFRIESESGGSSFSTIWYSPDIKLIVKRINETTVGHPMGRTKLVYEIIDYIAAEKPSPKTQLNPAMRTGIKAERPEWRVGYQWRYAWTTPAGKGTFTQELIGEDKIESLPVWITRSGKNEYLFDKNMLGLVAIRLGEKWLSKRSAPFQLLSWPLEAGKEWKINYILEQVQEKSSRTIDARIVVANVEEIKGPAGTFEIYKIEVYDNYTGKVSSEHWYSPKVKWFVKNKTYLANGVREEELLSFKND
jgi:hypothetical protein